MSPPVTPPPTILRRPRLSSYLIRLVIFILSPVSAVADAPLSRSLFHIVVPSSARDPPRPFPHPPPAADGRSAGERHRRIPSGRRSSSSSSSSTGLHPPPTPEPRRRRHPRPLGCGGRDGRRGGGDDATTARRRGILGVRRRHRPAPAPVEPASFGVLRPRRPACIPPPPFRTTRIIG